MYAEVIFCKTFAETQIFCTYCYNNAFIFSNTNVLDIKCALSSISKNNRGVDIEGG